MYYQHLVRIQNKHEDQPAMSHPLDETASHVLARLLENEDRYAQRVAQADVLNSEINHLHTEGDALMQTLRQLWTQRNHNSVDTRQHAKVVHVRDRLQTLCTQARASCEKAQLDPSARGVLDGIVQQLLDLHRVTSSMSADLPPRDAAVDATGRPTCLQSSSQSIATAQSPSGRLPHQHSGVMKPTHYRQASQVLARGFSTKTIDLAQPGWNEACSEPSTTVDGPRPYATSGPSRCGRVKIEAVEPEQAAPTPLEARMIERRSHDDLYSDNGSLWWSGSSSSSIESV